MNELCDLCDGNQLEPVYQASSGRRGLTVHVCLDCALVQSLPRIDHVPNHEVVVSGGADWGNIRYGKGFRTELAISLLQKVLDFSSLQSCVDIGSSRGSFVTRLRALAPQASILAVEPDAHILCEYSGITGIEVVVDRIERLKLPAEKFNLVYCNHTLEHLCSPRATLAQLREAMSPHSLLYLEVPNLDFVTRDDVLEEWFIDKHLYHFSQETLEQYLQLAGFSVVNVVADASLENLTVIARKSKSIVLTKKNGTGGEARRRIEQIGSYHQLVQRNETAIFHVARHIEALAQTNRVVLWGAGRIFDVLVRVGKLNVHSLTGVVDKHLALFLTGPIHEVPVKVPSEVLRLSPDMVIVASRSYFEEIKREVHEIQPNCTVLSVPDLLLDISGHTKGCFTDMEAVIS